MAFIRNIIKQTEVVIRFRQLLKMLNGEQVFALEEAAAKTGLSDQPDMAVTAVLLDIAGKEVSGLLRRHATGDDLYIKALSILQNEAWYKSARGNVRLPEVKGR